MQRLGILSEDYDFKDDRTRLQTETPPLASLIPDVPEGDDEDTEDDLEDK